MKTPKFKSKLYAEREIKPLLVSELSLEDVRKLVNWCNCHTENLFEALDLQAILELYAASSEWESVDAWLSMDNDNQHDAAKDWIAIHYRAAKRQERKRPSK